ARSRPNSSFGPSASTVCHFLRHVLPQCSGMRSHLGVRTTNSTLRRLIDDRLRHIARGHLMKQAYGLAQLVEMRRAGTTDLKVQPRSYLTVPRKIAFQVVRRQFSHISTRRNRHSLRHQATAVASDSETCRLTRKPVGRYSGAAARGRKEAGMQPNEFDDPAFLARLRDGDEAAYKALVRRFHRSLTAVAQSIIGSQAQAEEVVQDAWLAVFSGIGQFERRSSLATWLFTIVLNRARTRATRERRLVALPTQADGVGERAVPLSAFKQDGHWTEQPRLWDDIDPERIVGGRQLWEHMQAEIERLPAGQRAVLILRDIEGQSADDACRLLSITPENQRVLLHRARTRIRQIIDAQIAAPASVRAGLRKARGGGRPAIAERRLGVMLRRSVAALQGPFRLLPCW
ncbi:MAG: RNA polymerase sigma factor, partial [Rhodopila sp.]